MDVVVTVVGTTDWVLDLRSRGHGFDWPAEKHLGQRRILVG